VIDRAPSRQKAHGHRWLHSRTIVALLAVLMVGSDSLQRSVGLPASAGFVFQAIVVLCVLFVDTRRAGRAGR